MKAKSLNILFIPVDDLRPQLGCYGRPQMATPHIDRLASEGVLFTNAYCQVPVCGASRASLLTSLRPTADRFLDFATRADSDVPGGLTLPEHFRKHRYVTLANGKVFHHSDDTAERSWSTAPWHPKNDPNESWRNYLLDENRQCDIAGPRRGPPTECAEVADNAYYDGKITDHVIADLDRLAAAGEPFFLAAGFLKPHLPFNAPKRYWDLYRRADIRPADNPYRPLNAPDQALHTWGELRHYAGIPDAGPLSEEQALTLVHGYQAATSYTDAQVGRILAALDERQLSDRTIVVLWGDHGWQLGEHGLWCKHCTFDTSLHAPLIVRAPGMGGCGRRCDALVEFVDIYPTLCELAGLPTPDPVQGDSFAALLEHPGGPSKPAAFSRWHAGEAVKTATHLFTEWRDAEGTPAASMLYDHRSDRAENVNVAGEPENAARTAEMRALLRTNRARAEAT